MNTIEQVIDQLQACNREHVRAVVEPDDLMVLLDHLDRLPKATAPIAVAEPIVELKSVEAPELEKVEDPSPQETLKPVGEDEVHFVPEDTDPPKQGKLPEDFPARAALADAGINTFAQARKQRDSKDGLTAVPGVGEATAAKIEEALK